MKKLINEAVNEFRGVDADTGDLEAMIEAFFIERGCGFADAMKATDKVLNAIYKEEK